MVEPEIDLLLNSLGRHLKPPYQNDRAVASVASGDSVASVSLTTTLVLQTNLKVR